jgi:putative tryptophan/tyrosine transport system substrate-binding protein
MRRREFIALMGASVGWPLAATAQEAGRTYRVGGLSPSGRDSPAALAMLNELPRFGFVEGQNLTIYWRGYAPHIDLISEFATDLIKSEVDVIYVSGDAAIRAVQRATTTIPILGTTDDMVEAGLVKSLARPDGNTTGTSFLSAELDSKRQDILIEAVPGIRHIAAIADSNRTGGSRLEALQNAAHSHGVDLSIHLVASADEIPAAIEAANASGAAALNVLASPILYGKRQVIMQRVATLRLPTIYQFPEEAEEGGFIGYGPRVVQVFRDVMARQLAQLLRGKKPGDLPIEQPTNFELVINLKTANAMGVTVPEALLVRADKVIE